MGFAISGLAMATCKELANTARYHVPLFHVIPIPPLDKHLWRFQNFRMKRAGEESAFCFPAPVACSLSPSWSPPAVVVPVFAVRFC